MRYEPWSHTQGSYEISTSSFCLNLMEMSSMKFNPFKDFQSDQVQRSSCKIFTAHYAWNISLQKYTVNNILNAYWFRGSTSTKWFLVYLILGRIVIWQCWFLRRGENQSAKRKKTLGAKERTNNKLYPHMASMLGFEPRPHWWEASALTIVPSLAHYFSLR